MPSAALPAADPAATRATRVDSGALLDFVRAVMSACGADAEQTATVAGNLVWNDLAGRANHGVERLPILMQRLRAGLIASPCPARFTVLSSTVARLEGMNGFGQHLGHMAMRRAIALARVSGVGVVGVNGSNFYGTGAYFVQMAAAERMIGIALSNSFPKVAAPGGRAPVMGTNPLAFGAPRADGRSILVDMSTAALAGSTIRAHQRTGLPLPEGLVIDAEGAPISDPDAAGAGTLTPAAGAKGFGLALVVEILAGVLTGAGVAEGVGSLYKDFERGGNSGHLMLAIDIRRWMPMQAYFARLDGLAALIAGSGAPEQPEPRLPGAARWQAMEENRARGIALEPAVRRALCELAGACGVTPPAGIA